MPSVSSGLLPGDLPRVWFGAWGIGGWYWGPPRDKESISAIQAAIQSGIRAFDTAPVYGFGHSEELVGSALQGRRHEAFIATKCSLVWDRPGDPFFTTVHGGRSIDVRRNLSRSSILRECEESLLRLSTDYIDLYQIHWPLSPLDEAAQALVELKEQGKIRFMGLCNTNVEQIIEWKNLTGFHPAFVQERYSLIQRKIDAGLKPYTLKHSIPILAYSPLAQGLLTGTIRSDRVFGEGDRRGGSTIMDPEYISRIELALDQARAIASSYNVDLSQLAIAWVLSVPGIGAAITGIRDSHHAKENLSALSIEIKREDSVRLKAIFDPFVNNGK